MRSTDLESDHAEHGMHMSHEMPPTTAAAHLGHDRHTWLKPPSWNGRRTFPVRRTSRPTLHSQSLTGLHFPLSKPKLVRINAMNRTNERSVSMAPAT